MSNDSFQNKFKDQIQYMGKGGIASIQSNEPIQSYPNYYIPQNPQFMMNMNYQNMIPQNINYENQNFIPQQQQSNMNNNVKINKNKKKKDNNDNFSGWAEIYNNEQKNKKNNKNNIQNKNNRIKSGGEMIMQGNNNKNEKTKNKKLIKSVTLPPQNNMNNINNSFINYQINPMNPQIMMNNPNFNPYAPYQQLINPINNNNNFINYNQIPLNNNINNNFPNNPLINNYPNNNIYNNNKIQINNENKINELSKNNNSLKDNKNYNYVEYKPYTLKDYKELTRSKIVMGPLGANIGTKEWEEKKAKMKRMETYSNRINQTHKGITKLKKDSPQEEIEKNLKLKMENSHRYRTYEYGKLIRNVKGNSDLNSKMSVITGNNDNYYKDLGIINENEEFRLKTGDMKNNFSVHSNSSNFNFGNNDNNDTNKIKFNNQSGSSNNEHFENNNFNNIENNNETHNLKNLIQQNEDYKAKIADIKNSLL